jgi:hypothetical protein
MEKWEAAARKFVGECEFNTDIDAVFLTGSYAAGNADKHSDIDLYIVLNDSCEWRVRGSKLVDGGFRIEYFANPIKQIKNYIDSFYGDVRILEINMILNGIIILNKNSTAEYLQEYCMQKSKDNFPALGGYQVQMGQYLIWDNLDELTRAHENKAADFTMQYYMFIQNAFEFYSRYICSPVPNYHHLYRWLADENYRCNFKLPPYRDVLFLALIKEAFSIADVDAVVNADVDMVTDVMYVHAHKIKDYIFNKAGGVDIDNFMLKGPLGK